MTTGGTRGGARGWMAAALVLLSAVPAAAASEDTELDLVRRVLRRSGRDERSRHRVVEELFELGSDAIPVYFEIATGAGIQRLLPPGEPFDARAWVAPPEGFVELAYEALERFPAGEVADYLEAELDRKDSLDPVEKKQIALRVLRGMGSADGLELVWRIAHEFGDMALRYPSVRNEVLGALTEILRRDPRAWTRVADRFDELPAFAQEPLFEAIGLAERHRGAALLQRWLEDERDPARRRLLLETLVRLEVLFPWKLAGASEHELTVLFASADPEQRRLAAVLVARLAAVPLVPELIAATEDADPRVQRAARSALESLAGLPAGHDEESWSEWLDGERAWWQERAEPLGEELRSHDGTSVEALRELARHPLFRNAIGECIGDALEDQGPSSFGVACKVLVGMKARTALPALVDALKGEPMSQREAAWSTLQAVTGEKLPLDPEAWHAALGE